MLSTKGPQRADQWKRTLQKGFGSEKNVKFVSERSVSFVLGDEPEELIEDVAARITADFELAAEEEEEEEEEEGNTREESEMHVD